MKGRIVLWVVLSVLVVLVVMSIQWLHRLFHDQVTYSLPGNFCTVAALPEPWQIPRVEQGHEVPGEFTGMTGAETFEFRQIDQRLAIALRSTLEGDPGSFVYSKNKYAFNPLHPAPVTSISDIEWSRGTAVRPSQQLAEVSPGEFTIHNGNTILNGYSFHPIAEHLYDRVALSPNRQLITLQSYSGNPPRGGEALTNYEPRWGRFFIQTYQVRTGARQFTVQGHFIGSPTGPLYNTGWLSDHQLLIDLFDRKDKFILCDTRGFQ